MDPLSFVVLRRIASKVGDGIAFLIDLLHHLTLNRTPTERAQDLPGPGDPGYLPRKGKR